MWDGAMTKFDVLRAATIATITLVAGACETRPPLIGARQGDGGAGAATSDAAAAGTRGTGGASASGIVLVTISPLHLTVSDPRAHRRVSRARQARRRRRRRRRQGQRLVGGDPNLRHALELGAQACYYVLGDFRHGMQLGAELLYLHLSDAHVSIDGEGVAVGPFVGYKFTADVGFTFDTQLGVEYVGARAMSSATGGSASGSRYIPLLNINVGWSF
jgi:hypothetical protein